MFETLLKLVKEHSSEAIVNNPAIPNEKNDAVIQQATSSIVSGLQSQLASGNVNDIVSLLGGKSSVSQSPIAANLTQNVATDLASKFGISSSQAVSIVTKMLPGILGSLIAKTNDPNDKSIDLGGLFNSLTGGKSTGVDFSKILAGGSGNSAMEDIAGKLSGGAKDALKNSGGIGDLLGGFLGKK